METPTPAPVEPKKSNTALIIGIVVVVLLCCCCLLLAVGAYVGRSQFNGGFPGLNSLNSGSPSSSGSNASGGALVPGGLGTTTNLPGVPSGGKGDDAQRTTAWGFLVVAAATDGCSTTGPKADSTTINVSQQPDSSGAWQEEWTVTCDSGSTKTYVVAFPSGDANVAEIKVTAK